MNGDGLNAGDGFARAGKSKGPDREASGMAGPSTGVQVRRQAARKAKALSEALTSRDEALAPTPQQVIPDGCNLGVVLRVVASINVLALLVALMLSMVSGRSFADGFGSFFAAATVLEAVVLLTLVCWCLLRRALSSVPVMTQRWVAGAVPVVLTGALVTMFGLGQPHGAAVFMMLAGVVTVGVLYVMELRARVFSPTVAEARYQALQSRIRPHFFFNSLNAVLAVLRDDPRRAERMLENIAELFRAVMADVRKLVPLEQELDLCRKYVEIEQTRLGERLAVNWQIGATHPKLRVPQLLLQPIIENAVRYGAEKIAGQCEIVVRVRQLGFTLEVLVSNPIAKEPIQREGNQIGLANIRGRLALIYDLEASLEARVRRDRFELTLTLPVEHKQTVM